MKREYHRRVSPNVRSGGRERLVHNPPTNTAYTTIPAKVQTTLALLHPSLLRNVVTAPMPHNITETKAKGKKTSQFIILFNSLIF